MKGLWKVGEARGRPQKVEDETDEIVRIRMSMKLKEARTESRTVEIAVAEDRRSWWKIDAGKRTHWRDHTSQNVDAAQESRINVERNLQNFESSSGAEDKEDRKGFERNDLWL
jgi:hypothetical protein